MNKIIKKLCEKYQTQICSIFLANEVVDLKKSVDYVNYNFKDIEITDKGLKLISESIVLKEGFIDEYRALFPRGKKGDKNTVISKLTRFLTNNSEVTESEVILATKQYISKTSPVYVYQADNYIYKHYPKDGERSALAMSIEELYADNNVTSKMSTVV